MPEVVGYKGFTGSGVKKFIHKGKKVFAAIVVATEKVVAGRRGGSPQKTNDGVSLKSGYRDRDSKPYKASPSDSFKP